MFDSFRIIRAVLRRPTLFPLICFFTVFVTACGSNTAVERIPGTERAAGENISISPDEKWLVFWEWVVTPTEQYVDDRGEFSMRLASLDLDDGTVVKHELAGLPKKHRSISINWAEIERWFDPPGWYSNKFYINMYLYCLVVDPASIIIKSGRSPTGLTCSDCPPNDIIDETIKKVYEWYGGDDDIREEYSISWRNGQSGNTIYRKSGKKILRFRRNGSKDTLVEVQSRFRTATVSAIRISPDETYLAYTVNSKIKSPVPLPDMREEVFVLHLESKREKKLGRFRSVGNLIWSPDGRRLYYAGHNGDFTDMGVYRVDVGRLFK